MARAPFSLFLKNTKKGKVWYVRYYNPEKGKYDTTKSTGIISVGKKGRRKKAYEWAREHIPEFQEDAPKFLAYLERFWSENSDYLRMKRIAENKDYSSSYLTMNRNGIRLYVKTYKPFKKISVDQLTPGIIEDWKLWALEKGVGVRRVNQILQSMQVPVRYAYFRGDIEKNPFRTVKKIPYQPKDKGVLNVEEVKKLVLVEEQDPRVYAGMLLALFAGMRRGEVRGLLWEDIDVDNSIITIQHNFVNEDGLKGCKWNSSRKVPLHPALVPALENIRSLSEYTGPQDFVLFNLNTDKKPCSLEVLRGGFRRVLKNMGIPVEEQKKRNLTFHGLRHTFVTLARVSGLPDITVQALAGHKSNRMMDHYSHGEKVIDFKDVGKKMLEIVS